MKEYTNKMADALEKGFGSQLFVQDGHFLFSPPVKALKATVYGNSQIYWNASALMQSAEYEQRFIRLVRK